MGRMLLLVLLALAALVLFGGRPSARLDVRHTYDGCGSLCWLGAFHMVLQRPDLPYEVLVLHSNPALLESRSALLDPVCRALGYRIEVDGTDRGEVESYAVQLGGSGRPGALFGSEREAFAALEERVGGGEPVMAHVDLFHLQPRHPAAESPGAALHYLAVVGFDASSLYVLDPGSTSSADRGVPREEFARAWAATGHKIFRPVRVGDAATPEAALEAVRRQAARAPGELLEMAAQIRSSGRVGRLWTPLSTGAYRRAVLADWLETFGHLEAAPAYRQAAALYGRLRHGMEPAAAADLVERIAAVEREAAARLASSGDRLATPRPSSPGRHRPREPGPPRRDRACAWRSAGAGAPRR